MLAKWTTAESSQTYVAAISAISAAISLDDMADASLLAALESCRRQCFVVRKRMENVERGRCLRLHIYTTRVCR